MRSLRGSISVFLVLAAILIFGEHGGLLTKILVEGCHLHRHLALGITAMTLGALWFLILHSMRRNNEDKT